MTEFSNWADHGECKKHDPKIWFPDDMVGSSGRKFVVQAKSICSGCAVINQCLNYAIANQETYGIWGGQTPKERNGRRTGKRNPTLAKELAK